MAKELTGKDFPDNVVLLKLTKNYEKYIEMVKELNPKDFLLYEASRGYWNMNMDRAKNVKYAMPVHDDKILTVYEVDGWYQAGSSPRRCEFIGNDSSVGDLEFIGWLAKDEMLLKYVNQTIHTYRNPVNYIENGVVSDETGCCVIEEEK